MILKWLAATVFVLAVVCRLTLNRVAFGFATATTPALHREVFSVSLGVFAFWVLLCLGMALVGIRFLKAHSQEARHPRHPPH